MICNKMIVRVCDRCSMINYLITLFIYVKFYLGIAVLFSHNSARRLIGSRITESDIYGPVVQ